MTPHRSMPSACANMSRRKQSNPKAVLKAQEEEYITNSISNLDDRETMTESSSPVSSSHDETVSSQSQSTCNSPPPPPTLHISRPSSRLDTPSPRSTMHTPLDDHSDDDDDDDHLEPPPHRHPTPNPNELVQVKMEVDEDEVMPRLRLNVGLASDPALQPDAKDIKALSEVSTQIDGDSDDRSSSASSPFPIAPSRSVLLNELTRSADLAKTPIPAGAPTVESVPRHVAFVCDPCGIKFSSLSTLEAHQTYYCSHNRKDSEDATSVIVKPGPSTDGVASSSVDSPLTNHTPIHNRNTTRTSKQYACTHCTYSADKKVSLNRHMRMHQTSPATSSIASNGDAVAAGAIADNASPVQLHMVDRYCSDCDIRFSSTKTYRAHKQHYCSGRQREGLPPVNATVQSMTPKSRSQSPHEVNKTPPVAAVPQPYLALPTNPIIIIPYSLIRGARIMAGPLTSPNISNPDHTCFVLKNGCLHPIAQSLNMPAAGDIAEPPATVTRPKSPVPTTVLRESPSPSSFIAADLSEHSKPAKRDQFNRPMPSTPLDLSVQRSIGFRRTPRDRSDSVSSTFSDEPESDRVLLEEGKENVSIDSNASTPEQIVCAPSLPGSPGHSPSPKQSAHSPRGVLIASPNPMQSPTTFQQQSMMLRQLLPADLAARLSDPAAIERQNIELALRLSAASNLPESQLATKSLPANKPAHVLVQPQVFVKQGVSKCRECNIVFCKYENYIAHKKHYCSARMADDSDATTAKPSPPTSPKAISSVSTTSGGNGAIPAPTLAYQQLICAACGIKFTSLDNLNAHQTYYCPKRVETAAHSAGPPKDKCTKCKTPHDSNIPCTTMAAASPQFPHNAGVYKCPMCDAVSLNAADSRRHLETHTSIKAFRCSICRYRGNTLRGMRTHIRMHFDRKATDVYEEQYISCILEDEASESAPPAALAVTQGLSEGSNQASVITSNQPSVIASTTAYSVTIKTEPLDGYPKPQPACVEPPRPPVTITTAPEPPFKRIKLEFEPTDDPPHTKPVPLVPPAPLPAANEPKYCNICDIKFNYLNTFLAHKQYYCKEAAAAKASAEAAAGLPAATAVSPKPTVTSLQ